MTYIFSKFNKNLLENLWKLYMENLYVKRLTEIPKSFMLISQKVKT